MSPMTDSGSDGGQARWPGLRHEQLGDARVGQAHHADLVVHDPVLGGHRLDHVVAVGHLGRLEVGQLAARAGAAPDVHPDGGEAVGVGEGRARLGRVRVGRVIARVLHDGRIRPTLGRARQRVRGEPHHRGQRHAVAHLDVVQALLEGLAVVEGLVGWVVDGGDLDRHRSPSGPAAAAAATRYVPGSSRPKARLPSPSTSPATSALAPGANSASTGSSASSTRTNSAPGSASVTTTWLTPPWTVERGLAGVVEVE